MTTDVSDPAEVESPDITLRGLTIIRHFLSPVQFRAAENTDAGHDALGTMDVRYSLFGEWYEVNSWWEGNFLERTQRGAFKRTIGQHNDPGSRHEMKTLFNHGMDMYVNDKLLGDITDAREERDSPVNTVNVWDTSYNRDLLPGLKRGSYGSSFMFTVSKESIDNDPGTSDHNPKGIPERTITEVVNYEAGPVTWPANPGATAQMNSAQPVWSGTDDYYEQLGQRQRDGVAALRQNVIALRSAGRLADFGARPVADSQNVPAEDSPPAVAEQRSPGLSPAARSRRIFLLTQPK